jgi:hypothetical protein
MATLTRYLKGRFKQPCQERAPVKAVLSIKTLEVQSGLRDERPDYVD